MSPQELIRKKYNVQMESDQNVPDEDLDGKKTTQTKKKILADWKKQVQNNQKFETELKKNPNFFDDLKRAVERLKKELMEITGEGNGSHL